MGRKCGGAWQTRESWTPATKKQPITAGSLADNNCRTILSRSLTANNCRTLSVPNIWISKKHKKILSSLRIRAVRFFLFSLIRMSISRLWDFCWTSTVSWLGKFEKLISAFRKLTVVTVIKKSTTEIATKIFTQLKLQKKNPAQMRTGDIFFSVWLHPRLRICTSISSLWQFGNAISAPLFFSGFFRLIHDYIFKNFLRFETSLTRSHTSSNSEMQPLYHGFSIVNNAFNRKFFVKTVNLLSCNTHIE